MNKKGFTLVEVIMVIAIIALLSLLLVPNVIGLINKNNIESCENLKDNIESAAKIYVNNNKYDLNIKCYDSNKKDDTTLKISLQTLVNSGDLKTDKNSKIINPIDDAEIDLTSTVEVTYDCDSRTFSYEYDLTCE